MKPFLKTLTYGFLLLLLLNNNAASQVNDPSYILTPLKAKYADSTNPKEIVLVFKHYSKSGQIEKLIISGKLTYSLGDNSQEKTEILGQGTNKHTVAIFGKDVMVKSNYVYDLIKDNPKFSTDDNVRFIVFTLRNLTDKYVDKMTFTYGLWEPLDESKRIETKYEIPIDR